ncbi:MAG: VTT domain-containing protein [Defluviitaleaceae bacterium]|nr:VTT domain-containing protein [Defluviitaleaceae bacterium]
MAARLKKRKMWIFTIIVLVTVSLLFSKTGSMSIEDIVNFVPTSFPLAALVFLLLYFLKAIIPFFPIAVLYVSAGIVFPAVWGIAVSYCGITVMISIGYLIGKTLGENKIEKILKRRGKVADFLYGKKDNLSSLCFISRILPIPEKVTNLFHGAVKMPFGKYICISLLGLSPAMIPLVIAGSSIANPLSLEFLLPFGISLSISLAVFIIFKRLGRNNISGGTE